MGKVSDDDTKVVLRKLAFCFPAFYLMYYASAGALPPLPRSQPRCGHR